MLASLRAACLLPGLSSSSLKSTIPNTFSSPTYRSAEDAISLKYSILSLRQQSNASASASGTADPKSPVQDDPASPPSVDPVKVVLQAIDNVRPLLEVKTMKVAARVLYIPYMMHPKKQRSVAVRWLVQAAQSRKRSSKRPMAECLALEVLLAYQRKGSARQKRDDLHQLAVQNRANMQMRWW